jgi:hypothetical protein
MRTPPDRDEDIRTLQAERFAHVARQLASGAPWVEVDGEWVTREFALQALARSTRMLGSGQMWAA